MLVSTLDLGEIMDLPRQYGPLIRTLAGWYGELQALLADRFLVVSNHQGHIIWRVGSEQALQKLTEFSVAPGFRCSSLAGNEQMEARCISDSLRLTGAPLPNWEGVSVWIGQEMGPDAGDLPRGEGPADPVATLVVRFLDLKSHWEAEEFQRRQFAIERRKLETFYQLTSELSELNTPVEILDLVAKRVSELMDAGTTIVFGLNPTQTRLIPLCGHKIPPDQLKSVRYEIETSSTFIARVHESGQIKRIEDVNELAPGEALSVLSELGLRSVLMVPIRLRDRALGVMVVGRYVKHPFETSQAEVLSFVAHQIALILDNSQLRANLNKRVEDVDRELNLAKGMQGLMVPQESLSAEDVEVVGATIPAKQLGGDYFDYFVHGDRMHIIVADIMGKGVSAALLMSILRSHFRTVFQHSTALTSTNINRFSEMVYGDFKPQRAFATILLVSLHLTTREVSVFSAGHYSPMVAGPDGIREGVQRGGPALGLFNRPVQPGAIQQIELRPGEALLAYTDGVLDALNEQGERFGSERLRNAFASAHHAHTEPPQLLQAIRQAIDQFALEQPDDTTLLVLRRNHA